MHALKKISFLFFSAVLLQFPLTSMAMSSTKEMLNDYSLFSNWVKQHSSFRCSSNYLQEKMEEQIPRVLFLGLRAVMDVNPELMSEKLESMDKAKVLFTCVPEKKDRGWGALYDPTSFYVDSDSFKFSTAGNIIVLPENIVRDLFVDPVELKEPSTENPITTKQPWFVYAAWDDQTYNKASVVHEYLHYMGFDNFPSETHNSVGEKDSLIRFDDDVVISCAELSFPTWTLQLKHGLKLKNGAVKDFNLGKACLMCAMAKNNKKGLVRIDASRAEKAISACAPYREIIY